ncbi:MAG: hypothetical protein ACI9FR_002288 [Cryomorphaceae bacterium]|jgi:hypothetical protein
MHEKEIARNAFEKLRSITGLHMQAEKTNSVLGTCLWADMLARLDHTQIELIVSIRQRLMARDLSTVIGQLKLAAGDQHALLITEHIEQASAVQLRDKNVNYLDIIDNAYINIPPFYVLIQGEKSSKAVSDSKPGNQFSTAELKVIFALLSNPKRLNANYGEIASSAKVALGMVGTIVRHLKDQDYFVETSNPVKREWSNRQKLIAHWVEQYPKLRRKHYIRALLQC